MTNTPPLLRLVGGSTMATARGKKSEDTHMARDGQKSGARGVNCYDHWADILVYIAEGRQRMGLRSTVADVLDEVLRRERAYLEKERDKVTPPSPPKMPD